MTLGALKRKSNWREELEDYIRSLRGSQFDWGELNCGYFTADAILAMTGTDIAANLRGLKTKAGVLSRMKRNGYNHHVDVLAERLPEIAPAMAHWGDAVMVEGDSLGIVQGRMIYVMGLQGLGVVPRTTAVRAFKV